MSYLLLQDGASHLVLEDGDGALLLEGDGPGPIVAHPGGTFHRPRWSWPRTLARPRWAWSRVWRYTVVRVTPDTKTVFVSDDRDFLFDYSSAPELVDGDTIDSAAIVGGTGLSIGPATKTTEVRDKIPAGLAVQVRISGWVAGEEYNLACVATLDTTRKLTIPGRLVCAADYEE